VIKTTTTNPDGTKKTEVKEVVEEGGKRYEKQYLLGGPGQEGITASKRLK